MKVTRWLAACVAASAILLSGCGSSSTTTSSLELVSVDPVANAMDVPLTTCPTGSTGPCGGAITLTFNRLVVMQTVVVEITPLLSVNQRCPAAPAGVTGCPAGASTGGLFAGAAEGRPYPVWPWALGAALAGLGVGFALGALVLDRYIRRKYGGLRIY